ncbi:hypothetical protein N8691_01660 [Candidatus Pelagibacter sp.]|jgi:hypothetical protein|nr:hypothetical protein [Candidatus Pelagibacter sp.]
MKKIQITFDLDWCPDFMIEYLLNILKNHNVRCIFFFTHKSKYLKLIKKKHFVGIHPNFHQTHSIKEQIVVLKKLVKIIPDFKFVRSHGLNMSTNLVYEMFKNFPNLKCDFSMLTYKSNFISLLSYKYFKVKINRMNYNWEDSIAIHDKNFNWSSPQYFGEKNIYNFHPIHIYYNTKNFEHYLKIKKNKILLSRQKKSDIDLNLINNNSPGARTFFTKVLNNANFDNNILKKI